MDAGPRLETASLRPPTRLSGGWFAFKRTLLQARRLAQDLASPPKRFPVGQTPLANIVEKRSQLYREVDSAEITLELGKVHNLRLVARALNGVEVPAGEVFSFWKHLGRCTQGRGFVPGRQIQEGCLMPAIGGGICQLTNSLYSAALDAGLEIVERHPHTRAVPGAQGGRDATVAWNYIDLRFRSKEALRIEAFLTSGELVVRILTGKRSGRTELRLVDDRSGANSCATCGQDGCHHWHEVERSEATAGTAYLVDQWFPEFKPLLAQGTGLLFRPLDGARHKKPAYAWPVGGCGEVRNFTRIALTRAFRQRRLADQGAARQRGLLRGSEDLAIAYARQLPFDVRHVVVSQNLLPFLWREGALGGRTFEVLMNRLPMDEIHRRLDEAAAAHPERGLLSDFRAPSELIAAEREALEAADKCYAAHTEVAASVSSGVLLDWVSPKPGRWTSGRAIVFPGPTASRKGAYEVREAARHLDLEVVLLGSELEGPGFWDGVRTRRMSRSDQWLYGVLAVIQPAVIEERPMALLKAVASGCPVVATAACGVPQARVVPVGNVEALVEALRELVSTQTSREAEVSNQGRHCGDRAKTDQ